MYWVHGPLARTSTLPLCPALTGDTAGARRIVSHPSTDFITREARISCYSVDSKTIPDLRSHPITQAVGVRYTAYGNLSAFASEHCPPSPQHVGKKGGPYNARTRMIGARTGLLGRCAPGHVLGALPTADRARWIEERLSDQMATLGNRRTGIVRLRPKMKTLKTPPISPT
jgi:hypothetical protein